MKQARKFFKRHGNRFLALILGVLLLLTCIAAVSEWHQEGTAADSGAGYAELIFQVHLLHKRAASVRAAVCFFGWLAGWLVGCSCVCLARSCCH